MSVRLFILGLPGSGKGTISQALVTKLAEVQPTYYNVGEILRERAAQDEHIKSIHAQGGLVSSNKVYDIFENVLEQKAFVCDGSPRRPEEAKFILEHPKWINNPGKLVYLELQQSVAFQRLLSRGRFDDTENVIRKRFQDFEEITLRSIDLFRENNQLIKVNANQDIDSIVKKILSEL